ncbi:MAG: DUF3500 domain-containing protein [Planctomycetota bacterium]
MKHYPLIALLALSLSACQSQEQTILVSEQEQEAEFPAQMVSESTRSAATALIASLSDEQQKLVLYEIKASLRKDWHFIPRERQGLMLGDMTAQQKKLVHQLMQTALSESGYLKATDIIWLETILYELSNQAPFRDPGKYALQIFGDPADKQSAWGWRLEGHHLSLNLTYTPEDIRMTPLFLGTNPAVVQEGPLAGKRVLADVHTLAVELAESMNDAQLKQMMLKKKPRDIITGPGRERDLGEPAGIRVRDLKNDQKLKLLYLIGLHQGTFEPIHFHELGQRYRRLPKNEQADYKWHEDYSFAWAGPIDADKPFYYRIHGKTLVIEYSCQGRNHVHAVMHDLTDPLQEDLLKQHYDNHEHE